MGKLLLINSILFVLMGCNQKSATEQETSNDKPKNCTASISLEKYGVIHKFISNMDTVKLNSNSYVVINLRSCEGEMDFKEFQIDSGLVLIGHYKAATVLTKGVTESYNPITEKTTSDSSNHYRPSRSGKWEYYNKQGEVIKTENYN